MLRNSTDDVFSRAGNVAHVIPFGTVNSYSLEAYLVIFFHFRAEISYIPLNLK